MSFRNERFYRKFLPLDKLAMEIDLGKSKIASDGGRGAELIRNSLDAKEIQGEEEERRRLRTRLNNARKRLVEANKKKLVELFDLMLATGGDTKETIINRKLNALWEKRDK